MYETVKQKTHLLSCRGGWRDEDLLIETWPQASGVVKSSTGCLYCVRGAGSVCQTGSGLFGLFLESTGVNLVKCFKPAAQT